ncbi:hypothetical protein [Lacrimispora sp.]|uniref:hypothetical protein n=1 Tax=Lacrimispora sp. TaxID=2719234 RepID=UPI0028A07F6F|nr:hypothetical protein [Lacrimispora sp.]
MKSRHMYLLIICMFMTGCSNERPRVESQVITAQSNEKTENINDNNADKSAKGEPDHVNDDKSGLAENQDDIIKGSGFYGDYRITACKGTAAAYAMSQEEIDATIGNILSYQESAYAWNGNTIETNYQEETYSVDQIFDDFGIQATKLGIEGKEISHVTAMTEGNFIGNYIYVLDETTLLVYYEGVFFEAKRIEEN